MAREAMRTKVLLSVDPDILTLIDKRAAECKITRSAYLVACALGLLEPVTPVTEEATSQLKGAT